MVLCSAASCAGAGGGQEVSQAAEPASVVPFQEAGLSVSLSTDRSAYPIAAPITMTLRVENGGAEPITFEFTSGQRYDFAVYDAEETEAWRWSDGRMFTAALGTETLQPGEALVYSATLEEGLPDPGSYRIEGILTARDRRASASLVVRVE